MIRARAVWPGLPENFQKGDIPLNTFITPPVAMERISTHRCFNGAQRR